jgi:hypothetical protein
MALKINIDVAKIAAEFKELALEVEQDLNKAVSNLASMTHAKVAEMASEELHSTLKTLQDNLGFEEIAPGIWVVSIDQKALFLEEGIQAEKDMKPDLLKNATNTSKAGHKYRAIPFDHGKAPSQMTPYAQHLVAHIKSKLKKEKIPFKKIEKNKDGSPRTGKLHSFDIDSEKPTARASTPALKGVSIYQSVTATGNVRRDILTFRTVSEGPASQGKWIHPGLPPKHFLDRASEWALKEWENNILPAVLEKYKG